MQHTCRIGHIHSKSGGPSAHHNPTPDQSTGKRTRQSSLSMRQTAEHKAHEARTGTFTEEAGPPITPGPTAPDPRPPHYHQQPGTRYHTDTTALQPRKATRHMQPLGPPPGTSKAYGESRLQPIIPSKSWNCSLGTGENRMQPIGF